MEIILAFLLKILAIGGVAASFAFALFRFWGEKWIENKFQTQLERIRHTHALEIQEFRKNIDGQLNRIIKIQDKEFTVLPEVWLRLYDANLAINIVVALFRRSIDLDRMSEDQFNEFLIGTRLKPASEFGCKFPRAPGSSSLSFCLLS